MSPGRAFAHRRLRPADLIGLAAVVSLAATVWLGLWVTPPDAFQHNLVRLVYVHPAIAWVTYLALGVATLASALYLWPRTRAPFWDRVAGSSVEIGVVFGGLTLITGSIWGRPTWGVWWTWDARLTSTALLEVLYLGYLALRRVPGSAPARAKRSAIAAIVAFADVPVDHFSVQWWRTLHQAPSVFNANLSPTVHGSMLWTMMLGFAAFTLAYCWLLVTRYRIEALVGRADEAALTAAIAERRAEGAEGAEGAGGAGGAGGAVAAAEHETAGL